MSDFWITNALEERVAVLICAVEELNISLKNSGKRVPKNWLANPEDFKPLWKGRKKVEETNRKRKQLTANWKKCFNSICKELNEDEEKVEF